MKLNIGAWLLVALGSTVVGTAQQPAVGETVTVSGCLERAQRNGSVGGTVVGTSASPATAAQEANSSALVDAYLLTAATPASASDSTTTGTATGTATGTTGRVTMTSYGLAGHEAEFAEHTGARVEVTGTVVPAATSGLGSGGAATASGVKRVRVASFKVLADHCDAP